MPPLTGTWRIAEIDGKTVALFDRVKRACPAVFSRQALRARVKRLRAEGCVDCPEEAALAALEAALREHERGPASVEETA